MRAKRHCRLGEITNRDGRPAASFVSDVEPGDRELTRVIERLLAASPAPRG